MNEIRFPMDQIKRAALGYAALAEMSVPEQVMHVGLGIIQDLKNRFTGKKN